MDLKAFLLKNVDAERFYRSEIEDYEPGQNSLCPFHDDANPSFGINLEKQGTFRCYTCGAYGTTWIGFYAKKEGLDDNFGEALQRIYHRYIRPVVPQHEIDTWHETLAETPSVLEWLEKARGIRQATLEEFKIGWDGSTNRITIPIQTSWGFSINVRKYAPWRKGKTPKVISYAKGYGEAYVYPKQRIRPNEPIHIFEGELDTLLARQHGINGITSTGGAGGGHGVLVESVGSTNSAVCYDNDEAGQSGARELATALRGSGSTVRIISLPIKDNGEDFTDFIVKYGNEGKSYLALFHEAEILTGEVLQTTEKPIEVSLYKADKAEYFGKRISLTGHVVGKSIRPHEIPVQARITCTSRPERMCAFCSSQGDYSGTIKIDPTSNEAMSFIGQSESGIMRAMKRVAKCGNRCQIQVDVEKTHPIEEVTIVPELDSEASGAEYVLRSAFTVGSGLQSNSTYRFVGRRILDPRDSTTNFVFDQSEAAYDSIDAFILDEETHNKLERFQVASTSEAIQEAQDSRYRQYSEHVTRIYGRRDLHEAVDLVFFSPLSFEFNGSPIRKGWLEALIVGDTRTGKGYVGEGLHRFYGLGEVASGENASFAGLVGGVQQVGSGRTWSITWGIIPRNDRRLVILDEVSSLSLDDIARMSRIRSEGIAEVVKIQAERTRSRTRLIWLGNPRDERQMRDYEYGVQAVRGLIGKSEDIARFDYAMVLAHGDVDTSIINCIRPHVNGEDMDDVAQLNKLLILWVWSRTHDQVKFTDAATTGVLRVVQAFAQNYHPSIPLIQHENFSEKVAKIAVAVAARVFSTDDTGASIIVDLAHVQYAAQFINNLYLTPTMGYRTYSKLLMRAETITNYEELEALFPADRVGYIVEQLMQRKSITLRDIQEILDEDPMSAREVLHSLINLRVVRVSGGGRYVKTPDAIRWFREKIHGS